LCRSCGDSAKAVIKKARMKAKEYTTSPYSSRQERSQFAYREYQKYFGSSVLDVCGFQGGLGKVFPGNYVNVDMDSRADYVLNLDAIEKLPFPKAAFDTVVCTDGLEHLENIHGIFDEMCRVAKQSVIISMPNAWINVRYMIGGLKEQFSKHRPRRLLDRHWILPVDKPEDRHRWFYSLTEADALIGTRGSRMGFEVVEYNPHVVYKNGFSLSGVLRAIHKTLWSQEDFVNLYAWVGWWVLLRKKDE
jgi:hypothetical protein